VEKNWSNGSNRSAKTIVDYNPNSMYSFPFSEEGIVRIIPKLKGKASAGFYEISDLLIKEYIRCINKPLNFIFNESINPDVFAN
jgi:hypothetical protein